MKHKVMQSSFSYSIRNNYFLVSKNTDKVWGLSMHQKREVTFLNIVRRCI